MALRQYRIPVFYGIAQNITENRQNDGESPDACNMDTQSGRLNVAKGYVRESNIAFPAPENAKRLYVWRRAEGQKRIVATAGELFVLDEATGVWKKIYDFGTAATAAQYDFLPVKIANTEYLLIANGTARMAKWNGSSETAEAFGSTEGLSDIAVNFVEFYIRGFLRRATRRIRIGCITARRRETRVPSKTGRSRRRARMSAADL